MDSNTFAREVRTALAAARANVAGFRALPATTSASAVLVAFDRLLAPLNGLSGRVHLFAHAHPDAELRAVSETLEQEIAALATELSLDRGVYERLRGIDPAVLAAGEEARVLEHALRDYRRSGVDRDEPTRERLRALQEELVRLGQEFDRNIITGGRSYVVQGGRRALAGLPEDFLAAHPERADGTIELATDPAVRMAIYTFAQSEELRRGFYVEALNRAVPENLEVLPRLLAKRHELATALGYAHWADFITEDKMLTSAREVAQFLERVIELVRPRAFAEYAELLDQKRELDPRAESVEEWDRLFLTERLKGRRYGVKAEEARPYFAYPRVLAGVLSTSAALYGVEFVPRSDASLWHPSVRCYDVRDGGEVVARFYLDMHPREGKFKHAAMFHLAEGVRGEALPEACLVCNFPEPRGDDPGLLLHDEVTTFFHEFGHLLHHLFGGRQRFLRFSGIATEGDFVEVPSQMYEEWAWNDAVLAGFARHHQSDAPIPSDLVRRMRAAEEYGKALHVLQQMFYARLSLELYNRDPAGVNPTAVLMHLKRELLPIPHAEGTYMHASFGHLHGYSAMYYTYMWSLVIAKDLFTRFQGDLMSSATANEYRSAILGAGGSKDARDLVRDFLGREYGFEAFESWVRGG